VLLQVANRDILGVTESWCHEGILDKELSLAGFSPFRVDRDSRRGGGVILYVRGSLQPTAITVSHIAGVDILACQVSLNGRLTNVVLCCRPPIDNPVATGVIVRELRKFVDQELPFLFLGDLLSPGWIGIF